MMYLRDEAAAAQGPFLARQTLASSSTTPASPPTSNNMDQDSIEVGSFYEIDHSMLPPRTPDQLFSIRVVMVNKKKELKVSLRFPSVYSIDAYFMDGKAKTEEKQIPALDEKHEMEMKTAAKVLYRRISYHEFAERKNFSNFWATTTLVASDEENSNDQGFGGNVEVSRKGTGSCLSELNKFKGLVQWRNRKKVRFLGLHQEVLALEQRSRAEKDYKNIVEEEVKEEQEDHVKTRSSFKRKLNGRSSTSTTNEKSKTGKNHVMIIQRPKRHKQNQTLVPSHSGPSAKRKPPLKNYIERWSAARYKLAEQNMLKVMKAKGAVFGNPILRPALRAEARKLIGDTGLLDHLLKHMADKLAPGGNERFRRRHNSDGVMEFWIESADLAQIRKQAGVNDSCWIPPPGWKLGDNPTQDPVCAKELKAIKEEMINMKKGIEELESKKQEEDCSNSILLQELREEMTWMKKDIHELGFKGPEEDLTSVTTNPNSALTNVQLVDHEGSFLLPKVWQKTYTELVNRKAKTEKQLMEVSEWLSIMEEQMVILKSVTKSGENGGDKEPAAATVTAETKAAKIQRLKSGFRIYKPQGNFLWPNMVTLSQPSDPHVVQTPPSVSSSTISPPNFLHMSQPPCRPHLAPPVKPLAVRLSSISEDSHSLHSPRPVTPSTSLINLNEAPNDEDNDGPF